MSAFDLAAAYRSARERITEIVRDAGGDAATRRPVPATPGWTVHDVVAHLRGIVEDALAGNMAGAPGDAWTALQVERGQGKDTELLLEEWADDASQIEALLATPAGGQMTALVIDIHTHEQDLRGALERPGEREGAFYDWALPIMGAGFRARAMGAGLATVRVRTEARTIGDDADPVGLEVADWELFRVFLGRRSAAQIAGLEWIGVSDPRAYVAPLVVFGPALHDVVE